MKVSLTATTLRDQKGSVLVGLVIAIVIFAALGTAMLSLTSTSAINQVWASSSSRAYYLAESGFRYAETEYKYADDTDGDGEKNDDMNQKLKDLHSPEPPSSPVLFTFSNNMEKFELKIYPYYLVTSSSHTKGDTSFQAEFSGEKPVNFAVPTSGKLKIGLDPPYTYTSYDSGTGVFSISTPLLSNISDNMNVYLVTSPSSDGIFITNDGDLTLADASFFPERNGIFSIDGDGTVYAYESKTGSTLHNIFDVNDPDRAFSVSSGTSDDIVLKPFLELYSIGIVDYGSSTETRRKIVYNVPLSASFLEKAEFYETFEDMSKWEDSAKGSHEVQTIGGDKALRVTSTEAFGGFRKASLIGLKWSETTVDLATAHRLGNRYFLDYDAQVKVGYTDLGVSDPPQGYLPRPIPKYFAAGLSFRLDENLNSYGLSFLRGSNSALDPFDNINNNIVPQDDTLLIVLWQKSGPNDEDSNWLAYKDMTDHDIGFDDMEGGGTLNWTAEPPEPPSSWAVTAEDFHSGTKCWTDSPGTLYEEDVRSTLTFGPLDLSGLSSAILTFWHKYELELDDDYGYVQISADGTNWSQLAVYTGFQSEWPEWVKESIQISDSNYLTTNVSIRFQMYTKKQEEYDGWYIDDVTITGFPLNEATLLVRIKESASISFDSGGPPPIEDGDIIVGVTSSASGTVNGTPIIASGTWAGNDATGTILLKNVLGNFSSGEPLKVNGGNVTTKVSDPVLSRANYIRAYYGNPSDYGTPNIDPFDNEKHGNPRNPENVNWPPDEVDDWSADNDHFTLIQWDKVSVLGEVPLGEEIDTLSWITSLDEPGAVIRSTELVTPTAGIFNRTELGLHTFGHGSLNVYFDDFALQTEIYSTGGFLPAIQE